MTFKNTNRPLGERQTGCLESLLVHGGYPGHWQWTTPGETRKILRSLQQRGYCVPRISGSKPAGGLEITREGICKLLKDDGMYSVRYRGKDYSPALCAIEWHKFIRQFPLASTHPSNVSG